ncbi:MAG: T9SS type A sorting domain-containing protein [bacterium]|nr:T9SS type A sorting domain-containing protein [bacterium]
MKFLHAMFPFLLMLVIINPMFIAGVALALEDDIRSYDVEGATEQVCDWTKKHNWTSDLTPEEFQALCGLKPPIGHDGKQKQFNLNEFKVNRDLPTIFSLIDIGGMTPVKNQSPCGACWAFCSLGALESAIKMATGEELDLSEQQIVSCLAQGTGCIGGYEVYPWWFARESGIIAEACFPYQALDTIPCSDGDCTPVATTSHWRELPYDMDIIKTAIMTSAVTSGFMVYDDMADYGSGCYEHAGSVGYPNHGVVLAGWDDSACGGEGAWLVKNSWGEDWGDLGGYFWAKYGTCSIARNCWQVFYDAGDEIEIVRHAVEGVSGDSDCWAEPGETIGLAVTLRNGVLGQDQTAVNATLSSLSPHVSILQGVASYDDLPRGGSAANAAPYYCEISEQASVAETAMLQLTIEAAGGQTWLDTLQLDLGRVSLLFVDDDNLSTTEEYIRPVLAAIGEPYHYHDVKNAEQLTAADLLKYDMVLWHSGQLGFVDTYAPEEQDAITGYLDGGGRMLMLGGEIAAALHSYGDIYDRIFLQNHLRAQFVRQTDIIPGMELNGVAGDPVTDGLTIGFNGPESCMSAGWVNEIRPVNGATEIFTYLPTRKVGLRYEGDYKLVFCGFGLEGITGHAVRQDFIARSLAWLGEGLSTAVSEVWEGATPHLSLTACSPFTDAAEIRFGSTLPAAASLKIYDVAGRLQRELTTLSRLEGESRLTWDGKNDAGRDLSAGVYLVRLESDTGALTRRMVKLK